MKLEYEVNRNIMLPSCLPVGLNAELLDITCVGDAWRRYIDAKTGDIHDGAEYWAKACALINLES